MAKKKDIIIEPKTLKISLALHEKIDEESGHVHLPMYRLAEIAWDLYERFHETHEAFGKTLAITDEEAYYKRAIGITSDEAIRVEQLLSILRSQHDVALRGVTSNLDTLSLLVELDTKRRDS